MKYKFEDIAINSIEKKKPSPADKNVYLGLEHLDSGCLTITRFGSDVAPIGEKLIMKKGDVLFGKRRAYQKKVAIAPFDGIFSAHGMVLRPKEAVIDSSFFPLFISSDYFLNAAIKISVGSLSPTVNWGILKDLEFELPSLSEQRKLAELLWAANSAREEYKKLLALTDELVKSGFVEMFGDLVTNPMGWEIYKIGDIGRLQGGYAFKSSDYVNNGIRLVKITNVNKDNLDWVDISYLPTEYLTKYSAFALQCGDIVMAMTRPIIKSLSAVKMAITIENDVPCLLNQRVGRFIFENGMNNVFFVELCKFPFFRNAVDAFSGNSLQPNISSEQVESIQIPVPPLELQNRFADFVRQADKSKFELQKTVNELEATYKSLLRENLG